MWPVGPCNYEGEGDRLAQCGHNEPAKKALCKQGEKHDGSKRSWGITRIESRARMQSTAATCRHLSHNGYHDGAGFPLPLVQREF